MKKAHLAYDFGADSGRAMLATLEDGRLHLEEVHRFGHAPQRLPSGLHWDIQTLWTQVVAGLARAGEVARDRGLAIASLGVDTWGADCGYLGASGQLLGLPYSHRDERNIHAFEATLERHGRRKLYEATGIQFLPINTLYQVVAQHDAEPEMLQIADKMLFMPDLLHYFLTGEAVVESTIASTSQMTEPRTGQWAKDLLADLGLPTQMLGPIVPSGTRLGPLREGVADDAGVDANTPVVVPASHDTASAVAAVPGRSDEAWCFLSSGTWSLMGVELSEPCMTEAAMEVPFTNEGGVQGTVRFLKNIGGLWLVQECRRRFEQQGSSYDYADLTRLAGEAEPFRTLVNPDHPPFLTPGSMPEKIAEFARKTDQPVPEDVGQFIRCCLESLALTYRHTLLRLEHVLGRRFEPLYIVGGGGKNTLLNQMAADAIGRPVIVGLAEATAAGNALVQAMGGGDVGGLDEIRDIVRASFGSTAYEPKDTAAWDTAYERYLQLL